eukprot:461715-Amorphochlora_amoeboformis.AAC.1
MAGALVTDTDIKATTENVAHDATARIETSSFKTSQLYHSVHVRFPFRVNINVSHFPSGLQLLQMAKQFLVDPPLVQAIQVHYTIKNHASPIQTERTKRTLYHHSSEIPAIFEAFSRGRPLKTIAE